MAGSDMRHASATLRGAVVGRMIMLRRTCPHRLQVRQPISERLYLPQDAQSEYVSAGRLPVCELFVTACREKVSGEMDDRFAQILAVGVISGGGCGASQLPNPAQGGIVLPTARLNDDEIAHGFAMLGRDEKVRVRH